MGTELHLPQRQIQLEPRRLSGIAAATRAACTLSTCAFGETFQPGWRAYRFHEFLADKLENCLTGKTKRLAISVPPGHGKSLEASVIFPARALTKYPTMRIFQAGWNGDLSKGFCRDARSLVMSDRYLSMYPDLIDRAVNRQDYWRTKLGGYYYSTGVGGGTGMRADLMLLDDPHKNRDEANSPTIRNSIWSWITSTALTRLTPDGVLIVIQTRWHEDDTVGRFTDPDRQREMEEAGFSDMNFEVIRIEAICENPETDPLGRRAGEALWPEYMSLEKLKAKRIEITDEEFDPLYQQKPHRDGGDLYNEKNLTDNVISWDQVPKEVREMLAARGWDLALTVEQQSDYSAGARGVIHKYKLLGDDGKPLLNEKGKEIVVEDFYVFDIDHGKRQWPEQKQRIIDLAEAEPAGHVVGLEAVGGFKIAGSEIKTASQGRYIVKSINVHKDKQARAQAWIAKIQARRMFLVRGPWVKKFLTELRQFPNGVHDDQVDAVSVLWETLTKKDKLLAA